MKTEFKQVALSLLCLALTCESTMGTLAAQQMNQSDLDSISQRAQKAMAAKDWSGAVDSLERLSRLAPNRPEIEGDLGLAYYSENRVFEAAEAFEHALKLNPRMTRAEMMLGLCYAELGRSQQAVPILAAAFRRAPDGQTARLIGLDLQRSYAALHQYDKAMAVADELLKRYPKDPEILFHSSRLHADQAYLLMVRLMQGAPGTVWSHYATAEVHQNLQQYGLAIAEYRKVLEMEPRLPGIHFRLGRAIQESSKEANAVDTALHEFELELAISPDNSDADYEIGEIYRERGQFGLAFEHFSKAVQHHPNFPQARIGLASTLISLGRQQEAVGHLLEALRDEPENQVAHFRLASVYRDLGDTVSSEREMALFQQLHFAGSDNQPPLSGASATSEVTQQTIDTESYVPR